jgi:hypothetical protein
LRLSRRSSAWKDAEILLLRHQVALLWALTGRFTDHHGYLVADHLEEHDHYTAKIRALDERIAALLDSPEHRQDLKNLATIPGIDLLGAQIIISELGDEMRAFPTPGHLASWLGLAGGHNESAGVKRKARRGDGNGALRRALGIAAFVVMGPQGHLPQRPLPPAARTHGRPQSRSRSCATWRSRSGTSCTARSPTASSAVRRVARRAPRVRV